QSANALYLMNDAGNAWLGPITPGTSATVQNSQCVVNGAQTSASGSGNTLTLNLSLNFKSTFVGGKNIYGWAQDNGNANSGWQPIGTWTVTSASSVQSISHVFFMLQENHSLDNYFGRMGQYRANKGFTDSFDGVPLSVSLND